MNGWTDECWHSQLLSSSVWLDMGEDGFREDDLGQPQLSAQQPQRRAHPSLPRWCLWVFDAVSQLRVLDFCSHAWRLT